MQNRIFEEMKQMINEGWTDGIGVSVGNSFSKSLYVLGTYESDGIYTLKQNILYDLASVSKIVTLVGICRLIAEGKIDIKKKVLNYPQLYGYKNIQNMFLYQLINFSCEICTKNRIADCTDKDKLNECIKNVYIKSNRPKYSDIGVIVLVHMIDTILGKDSFRQCLKKMWIDLNMKYTYWFDEIPDKILHYVQSYDNEFRLDGKNKIYTWNTPLGIVHDAKCRIIGAGGHAGIFSTLEDMSIFCQGLLNYKIISKKIIDEYIISEKYDTNILNSEQHFGLLVYKKTSNEKTSEVPSTSSRQSVAMSGYTGCYLLLDFENDKFLFIGSNRIHNRATFPNSDFKTNAVYKKNTNKYVYRKDILRDLLVTLN